MHIPTSIGTGIPRRSSRRRKMRTRLAGSTFGLLVGVSAAMAAGSIIAPAAAQDKPVHLKLSHWVPPSHPLQKALEDWGGSVAGGDQRHRDVYRVSVAATGQGLRPLRHGARRHRRRHLRQPGLSAGPLPHHRRRQSSLHDVERQGRLAGARRVVSQARRHGDEGRQVLPRLRARLRLVPLQDQEDHGARRHQGHEDSARRMPPSPRW